MLQSATSSQHSLPSSQCFLAQERALCSSERYLPAQYLAVKAALLKIQEGKGHVSRADVKQLPFHVGGEWRELMRLRSG